MTEGNTGKEENANDYDDRAKMLEMMKQNNKKEISRKNRDFAIECELCVLLDRAENKNEWTKKK